MLIFKPTVTVTVNENGKLTDKQIFDKNYCRTLGINLKNDLSWSAHLSTGKHAVLPAIRKQIGALSTLRFVLSERARLQLANVLIISKLSYLICIWGNTTANMTRRAQIVQNMAARFVMGCGRSTRQSDLMTHCKWLNIVEMTEYYSVLQFWKTLHYDRPHYLRDKLQIEDDDFLSTDIHRLQLTSNAFRCKTTLRWNALSRDLRVENTISIFKSGLRRQITERRQPHDDSRNDDND